MPCRCSFYFPSQMEFLLRELPGRSYFPTASSTLHFLEEEIHILRLRLEELAVREDSLTSPPVVEASCMLDDKINEYMNKRGSP